MFTAMLGIKLSNMRKRVEGNRKNRVRIPKVPTISTFKGGCERTNVLPSTLVICRAGCSVRSKHTCLKHC